VIQPGKQELFIKRVFDAPRELVWKVFTDPKLVAHGRSAKVQDDSRKDGCAAGRTVANDSAGRERK